MDKFTKYFIFFAILISIIIFYTNMVMYYEENPGMYFGISALILFRLLNIDKFIDNI